MPHVTPLRADDPQRVGRYQLAGRITGMPASGPAYLARSADGSELTLTLLGGDWAADSSGRERLATAAAAARQVAPFCAARILDAGLDGSQAFLVSEHVTGPSLLEVVSDAGPRRGADLQALSIGAATGLASIHQAGLVHGDFGPERLILGARGPQVVGFGIGPPHGAATPAADMRAWAQTVGFAATGRPPTTPGDLDILPPLLRRAVAGCLTADPAARPAARSVLRELLGDEDAPAGLLAQGSRRAAGTARSGGAARHPARAARRQRPDADRRGTGGTILWTAGVIAAVLVTAALVYLARQAGGHAGPVPVPAGASGTGTSAAAASGASSPATPAAATPAAATIPAALAQTWSGQVRQGAPADVFNVRIELRANRRSGRISYSGTSFVCSGHLSLRSAAAGEVTMNQKIVSGQQACANGVITLRPGSSPGTALFVFRSAAVPRAHGTLLAGQ